MEYDKRIIIRMSQKDADNLKEMATSNRSTVSKYLRKIIKDHIYDKTSNPGIDSAAEDR